MLSLYFRMVYMGWSAGFTIIESLVVLLYNEDVLTRHILQGIWEIFYYTDADAGGYDYLETKDGKLFTQVCVELVHPDFDPHGYVPKDENMNWWNGLETSIRIKEAYDDYFFNNVWHKRDWMDNVVDKED